MREGDRTKKVLKEALDQFWKLLHAELKGQPSSEGGDRRAHRLVNSTFRLTVANGLQALGSGIRTVHNKIARGGYVCYRGSILPPRNLRLCGAPYRDDGYFLESAELEAERLRNRLGCTPNSRVLDIGCGAGRLAIGIVRMVGDVEYYGIDVLRDRIEWCTRYISKPHPSFHFVHLDAYSERYNRTGKPIGEDYRLPFPDSYFDIVCMYGVITNMTEEHTRAYLREVQRLLKPDGKACVTARVEEGVPNVLENPPGSLEWTLEGPLNLVQYERNYFLSIIEESKLRVDDMERMGKEFHNENTAFYLSKWEGARFSFSKQSHDHGEDESRRHVQYP